MSNKVKIGSGIVEAETANAEDLAKMDGATTAVAVRPTTAMGVYDFSDDPSPLNLARIRIAHISGGYEVDHITWATPSDGIFSDGFDEP